MFSVYEHSGHLYVIEASGPCGKNCGEQGPDPNNIFYWFDVDTKTMKMNQKAKVADAALSLIFPTMALDAHGNASIGVTGASGSQHASTYLFTHLAGDTSRRFFRPRSWRIAELRVTPAPRVLTRRP